MLNAEKYKKEILEITEEGYYNFAVSKDRHIVRCTVDFACENCIFGGENDCGYSIARIKWLLSEYKDTIKLTRFEFEMLKWLEKEDYKFIVRSQSGSLMAYYIISKKALNERISENRYKILTSFNDLFQFIQWHDEEPTSIQDVLENCEVMEDDTDKR